MLRDAIGRDWQCGTLQVDPNLPERLDAEYVGEDGARHRPMMLHRAIFGSFERFLGILIEQYAGRFPLWLAPVQAVVATIVSDADDYAREVAAAFAQAGLAVETDLTQPEDQRQGPRAQPGACSGARGGRPEGGGNPHCRAAAAGKSGAGDPLAGGSGWQTCIRGNTTRFNFRQGGLILSQLFAQTSIRPSASRLGRRRWPLQQRQERTIARGPMAAPPTRDGPRVNEEIRIPQVRLIDQDGEMQGVLTVREAMQRAFAVGLDLVEISPNADPPVCKILDFGKFKYEQQKKRNEAKKKQKVIEIKEIKVRPNIDENDYQVKMRAMKSFIEEGDKVKVTLRFRGREMAHQDIGVRVLERIRAEMDTTSKVEQMPRMENRQMVMVLSPR